MPELKLNTSANWPFFVTNSAGNGVTGLTGFSALVSKNGAAFASTYISCPEMAAGWYQAQISAGIPSTAGVLSITLIDTNASALRVNLQFDVKANLNDDIAAAVSTVNILASTAAINASAALTAASGAGTLASAAWTAATSANVAAASARVAASAALTAASLAGTYASGALTQGTSANVAAQAGASRALDIQGRIPASLSSSGYMQSDIFAIVRSEADGNTFAKGVKTMVRGVVASTGTVSTIPTSLSGAETDFYKGLVAKFIGGTMAGEAATVTAYDASSKVLTVSSLTSAPAAGASFILA